MKKVKNVIFGVGMMSILLAPMIVFAVAYSFSLTPGGTQDAIGSLANVSHYASIQVDSLVNSSYYAGCTVGLYKQNILGIYNLKSSRFTQISSGSVREVSKGVSGSGTFKYCFGAKDNTCGWNGNSGDYYSGFNTTYTTIH